MSSFDKMLKHTQKLIKENDKEEEGFWNRFMEGIGKLDDETIKTLYRKFVPEPEVNVMSDKLIELARGDDATLTALAKELKIKAALGIQREPTKESKKVNEAHEWKAQGANPCPFCGSDDTTMEAPERLPEDPKAFVVVCSCGAQGPYKDTEQAAVDAWNKVAKAGGKAKESKVNEGYDDLFDAVIKKLDGMEESEIKEVYKAIIGEPAVNVMMERLRDEMKDDKVLLRVAKKLGVKYEG